MVKVSPFIYVNLTSASFCLLFLLFLLLTYFSKKNMNNLDNKIYKHMLIFNMLATLFYVLFYTFDILAAFSDDYHKLYPVVYFFSKLAPLMIVFWAVFFAFYIFTLTRDRNRESFDKFKANEKKYFKFIYIALFFIAILNFSEHSVIDLSTGIENHLLIVLNLSLYTCLLSSLFIMIKNRKKLDRKKLLPVYSNIPIVLLSIIGGFVGIPIVLLFIMMTVIDHLMYHTIENPDMRLINELELAKSQAEKASQAKSDFLSSMSHELRTPINAISGLSQMINMTDNVEEMHDDSKDILVASQKLLELVDSVLDINKIEANQIEVVEKL